MFPQQTAFSQQPSGAGFAAFGQTQPVVTPFGQVAAAGVSSHPFMTDAPTGQFPTGRSSTNLFLQPYIDILLEQTFMWSHYISPSLALVSLTLALSTREVFKKPALCIKHQAIRAEQRAPVTTFNL